MHLCNFGINVQPDPVKFIQLTGIDDDDDGLRFKGTHVVDGTLLSV